MTPDYNIKAMTAKIAALRRDATELKEISGGIEAVGRNADRILACVRMLEIDVSDAAEVLGED